MGKDNVKWYTAIFNDIKNDNNKIINFCDDIISNMNNFNCLSNCGLFSNGLDSIISQANNIKDNVNSLNSMIDSHENGIVTIENYLADSFSNIRDFSILSFEGNNIKAAAIMGTAIPITNVLGTMIGNKIYNSLVNSKNVNIASALSNDDVLLTGVQNKNHNLNRMAAVSDKPHPNLNTKTEPFVQWEAKDMTSQTVKSNTLPGSNNVMPDDRETHMIFNEDGTTSSYVEGDILSQNNESPVTITIKDKNGTVISETKSYYDGREETTYYDMKNQVEKSNNSQEIASKPHPRLNTKTEPSAQWESKDTTSQVTRPNISTESTTSNSSVSESNEGLKEDSSIQWESKDPQVQIIKPNAPDKSTSNSFILSSNENLKSDSFVSWESKEPQNETIKQNFSDETITSNSLHSISNANLKEDALVENEIENNAAPTGNTGMSNTSNTLLMDNNDNNLKSPSSNNWRDIAAIAGLGTAGLATIIGKSKDKKDKDENN